MFALFPLKIAMRVKSVFDKQILVSYNMNLPQISLQTKQTKRKKHLPVSCTRRSRFQSRATARSRRSCTPAAS